MIRGANQEAIAEAAKVLELTPDDSEALSLTARCYLMMNEFAKARAYAARGVQLYPSRLNGYVNMVDVEMRAGQNDKALAILRQGLKVLPRSSHLLWLLANLLIDMDKLQEAEREIRELQAINYPAKLVEYLNARMEMARGQWLAACRRFEEIRGTLITPELSYVLEQLDVSLGTCYAELGNHDQQIAAYRRAKKCDPFYAPPGRA